MQVRAGVDVFLRNPRKFLEGKRVGLITNQTGVTKSLKHTVDAFHEHSEMELTALYGPEHGVRGDIQNGQAIASYIDEGTGLPVHSLYGPTKKPTPEMLSDVDALIFDIQDAGTRYFTYVYTMSCAMEVAAESNIPFIVLDRPNPINGVSVEGNILNPEFKSFVGLHPIPIRHGMTVGELAALFNVEFGVNAGLKVVKMENWRREMWFDDTGLIWVQSSPNLPTLDTATVYPGTCLLEGTNVSEGRGTTRPFELVGTPWIHGEKLATNLNSRRLRGVLFRTAYFTPTFSKYAGKRCCGVQVHVVDREAFKPVETGLHMVDVIRELHPNSLEWIKSSNRHYFFDLLAGTDQVRRQLRDGVPVDKIINGWVEELSQFMNMRKRYLLY